MAVRRPCLLVVSVHSWSLRFRIGGGQVIVGRLANGHGRQEVLEGDLKEEMTYSLGLICGNLKEPIHELCDRQRKLHSISKNHETDTTPRPRSCSLFATAFFLRYKNSLCSNPDADVKLRGAESDSD